MTENMIIRLKDSLKLLGIVIMCACAALPCTLFINSNIDMKRIEKFVVTEEDRFLYDATVTSGNIIVAVCAGALALTTVIMLFFYIKHYIDTHKSELGILKALGYSNMKIAKDFWVFGFSVFTGVCIGFGVAWAMMPAFYRQMRNDWELPDVPLHFNPQILLYLIILPTAAFTLISIFYSARKLKRPALELIRGSVKIKIRNKKRGDSSGEKAEKSFLYDLRQSTIKNRPSLVFFIGFASFCYADMIQMSVSMNELASAMMATMMFIIGIVLAFITLFIAVTTVIRSNAKNIAMMRVFGYSAKECGDAILNGYRPAACVGFAVGTVYQYGLMRVMMSLFYDSEIYDLPDYSFDIPAFFITLGTFIVVYEAFMKINAVKIKKIPLKEVMAEE